MRITSLQEHLAGRLPAFIDDLRLLTGIDCGTRNKEGVDRVGAWVLARCAANSWDVRVHPCPTSGTIVEATVLGTGSRRILLLAHMDTVYPDGTVAARPMREEGDRLI